MHRSRVIVRQHLIIDAIRRRGSGLLVEVADRLGRQHWITFDFATFDESTSHADTMEYWRRERRLLTYVRGAYGGALIDDEASFWSSFGGLAF